MSDMVQEKIKNRPSLFAASGFYLLAAIGLWVVALAGDVVTTKIAEIWPDVTPEWMNVIISALYYLPFLVLPIGIWAARRGDAEDVLRLKPISFGTMLLTVIVAILCLTLIQDITALWMIPLQKLGLNVFTDSYIRPTSQGELIRSILAAAVITPVGEEILFRGVMLSAWERRGMRCAVMTTAILFAMLHGSLVGLPGEFVVGMVLAMLVIWTDSIYTGLVFHTAYNAGVIILNYLATAVAEDAAQQALMQTDIIAYMGGFGTILMMVLEILLLCVMISSIMRYFQMRHMLRKVAMMIREKSEAAKKPMVFHPGKMFGETEPAERGPLSVGTLLVLIAGVVSAVGMYGLDLISMLGG